MTNPSLSGRGKSLKLNPPEGHQATSSPRGSRREPRRRAGSPIRPRSPSSISVRTRSAWWCIERLRARRPSFSTRRLFAASAAASPRPAGSIEARGRSALASDPPLRCHRSATAGRSRRRARDRRRPRRGERRRLHRRRSRRSPAPRHDADRPRRGAPFGARRRLAGVQNADGICRRSRRRQPRTGRGLRQRGRLRRDLSARRPCAWRAPAVATGRRRRRSPAKALADSKVLARGKRRAFYAIGGTWRSLATAAYAADRLPAPRDASLHDRGRGGGRVLHAWSRSTTSNSLELDRGRFEEPPAAAALPAQWCSARSWSAMKPAKVVMSALGLREGHLFDLMDDEPAGRGSARSSPREEVAVLRSRSPRHSERTRRRGRMASSPRWASTRRADEVRLRNAACLLADIGWRAHAEYRGLQSLNMIANAASIGIDHPGRAFLALAVYYRHEGVGAEFASPRLREIASPRLIERARTARRHDPRCAYDLAPRRRASSAGTHVELRGGELMLVMPQDIGPLAGDRRDASHATAGRRSAARTRRSRSKAEAYSAACAAISVSTIWTRLPSTRSAVSPRFKLERRLAEQLPPPAGKGRQRRHCRHRQWLRGHRPWRSPSARHHGFPTSSSAAP